ncbi:ubiquitin ligase (cullin) of SCF [Dipsacomyces acuminosporus]|nr:ubiquitin ligase (cullin) of SCF [Dipsacomyces acuminosporus]
MSAMTVHGMPPSGDAELIWNYLSTGIDHILNKNNEGLESTRYMNLYTAVYNFCTSLKTKFLNYSSLNPDVTFTGAMLFGEELYRRLNEHITQYMHAIAQRSTAFKGDDLLAFYTTEWNKYVDSAKVIHNIFSYLNRHWVKREQEEGGTVADVNTMMLQKWRDSFFMDVRSSLLGSVFSLLRRIRDGEVADINRVKSVVDSFVSLGLDDLGTTGKKMEVYITHFQNPFIKETTQYYEAESARLLQEGTIRDYMVKISNRLQEEDDRALLYLHPDSLPPLKDALNKALIGNRADKFIAEFQPMLDAHDKENLHRVFKLLSRLDDATGLRPLQTTFTEHVKKAGLAGIKQISGDEEAASGVANEARLFVSAVLNVYDLYSNILHESFEDNPGFSKALDNAFRDFVNDNELCPSGESKAPMLLAYYSDSLLKKGGATARKAGTSSSARAEGADDEGELETLLSRVICVFRYIKDSDVFQKFYSRFLARRLVNEQSVSIDAEESMISKLKEISGVEFTSKLTRMFTDMTISNDLSEAFMENIGGSSKLPYNFNMKVLHTVSWPLSAPDTTLTLPHQLATVCDDYNRFYQVKHSGRKLNWLWQHSKAEIKMFFPKTTGPAAKTGYMFQVTTYQLAILLLFSAESGPGTGYDSSDGPTLTWDQIAQATGLDNDSIMSEMDVLCKARVLISSSGNPTTSSSFRLNSGFKSKKLRINLATTKKPEQKREATETMKSVDMDRMYSIQAAIVRIMKARKTLNHRQLIQEVISQIKLFQAQVGDIKKAIDALIEREYLERDASSRDVYSYLA